MITERDVRRKINCKKLPEFITNKNAIKMQDLITKYFSLLKSIPDSENPGWVMLRLVPGASKEEREQRPLWFAPGEQDNHKITRISWCRSALLWASLLGVLRRCLSPLTGAGVYVPGRKEKTAQTCVRSFQV